MLWNPTLNSLLRKKKKVTQIIFLFHLRMKKSENLVGNDIIQYSLAKYDTKTLL